MKKFWKILVASVLSFTMLFGLTACGGGDDTIYMYTEAGFAPFEYMSGTNIVGVDVEIAKVIANKLGKKLEVKNVDFDSIPEAVKKNPTNSIGIAGMTIKEIDGIKFSNPYFTSQQYILAKTGKFASTNGSAEISVLSGKKIGVQLSTTGDNLVTGKVEDSTLNSETEITRNKKFDNLALMLNSDALDAIVLDEQPAKSFVSKYQGLEMIKIANVEVESYGVAVASSQTELLKAINEALATITNEQMKTWLDTHNEASAN